MPSAPRRWSRYIVTRASIRRLGVLAAGLALLLAWTYFAMLHMPGSSYRGPLPALTSEQRALARALEGHVVLLADTIGPRAASVDALRGSLARAADELEAHLAELGYDPVRETFEVDGFPCSNVIAERAGTALSEEIIVVGAHYDGCFNTPAANDNASGVAAVLALARRFADARPTRTIRFALFANEEPPYFQTPDMGSVHCARNCVARGDRVVAMLSIETIGCYFDEPGTQKYPPPLGLVYPSTGDFIGFVGSFGSRGLVRRCLRTFRSTTPFPSEGAALPGWIPGVSWSDHWSFRQAGFPALMVTDTAPFRYPHYHLTTDTPDKLDYERMARVVTGLGAVLSDLAGTDLAEGAPLEGAESPADRVSCLDG